MLEETMPKVPSANYLACRQKNNLEQRFPSLPVGDRFPVCKPSFLILSLSLCISQEQQRFSFFATCTLLGGRRGARIFDLSLTTLPSLEKI